MSLTTSPTKRQQVINEITKNIQCGMLNPGERLATIREMSAHFNVSLSVIQNALWELTDNGFIECRGASGFYVKKDCPLSLKTEKIQKNTEGKILFTSLHHSDLVWRYTYEEYDKIREKQIRHLLMLAGRHKQFHFGMEQAEILRIYLRDNPKDLKQLKTLHDTGRLELLGGTCIPDLNLISGESIVRNLLSGRNWYRETFGTEPEVACMTDAFGMCAQLPQILVKCGYRCLLPGRMPNKPDGIPGNAPFRWAGLDNTEILTAHSTAEVTHLGYDCNVPVMREPENQLARNISALKYLEGNALVHYMTEEGEIEEDLFWIIEAFNRSSGKLVRFGRNREYFKIVSEDPLPAFRGEFNPVFSGCYTTRHTVKQKIRKAENLLFSAEFLAAASNTDHDFSRLWHELILAQFHDAACGCHTDAANAEIMKKLQTVISHTDKMFPSIPDGEFSICNFNNIRGRQLVCGDMVPEGVEVQEENGSYCFVQELPPCGIRSFRKTDPGDVHSEKCGSMFKTDFFEVDFSTPFPVIRNLEGENVFPKENFGEVLIRSDYGTMWTEKFMGGYEGREFQQEKVTEIVEGPVFIKAVTEGKVLPAEPDAGNLGSHWPGFESLIFRKEYSFPKHLDYFKLKLKLDWKGCNTKISIRFPVSLTLRNAVETYEVPFGSIVRKPYFEVRQENESSMKQLADTADYQRARGDWPALNWVNYSDGRKGLTIANTGTPGHQLVNGDILVSLLRSGTGIHDGRMVPQKGSYDNGAQEYEFAFRAHSPLEMEKACELGQMLNRPPRFCASAFPEGSLFAWDAANIQLSCLRKVDGGLQIRMYESVGRETETELERTKFVSRIFETDMSGGILSEIPEMKIRFRPFEIRTFFCPFQL